MHYVLNFDDLIVDFNDKVHYSALF